MELILGSVVSLVVQFIKNKLGTSSMATLGAVVGLSVVAAVAYNAIVAAGFWDHFSQILTTAGAFYSFVILRFEGDVEMRG